MICFCACGMCVSFFCYVEVLFFSFLFFPFSFFLFFSLVAVEASSYLNSRDYTLSELWFRINYITLRVRFFVRHRRGEALELDRLKFQLPFRFPITDWWNISLKVDTVLDVDPLCKIQSSAKKRSWNDPFSWISLMNTRNKEDQEQFLEARLI